MSQSFVGHRGVDTGMPTQPMPGFVPLTTLSREQAASAVQSAADAVKGLPF